MRTKWIFSVRSMECNYCVHCNRNPTKPRFVEKDLLDDSVLSGKNHEILCLSFQVVVLHGSNCKQVLSFFVTTIFERNTTSVN